MPRLYTARSIHGLDGGHMCTLPVEPQSDHGKDNICDKRGYCSSAGRGWWWAEEDVTLNGQHKDPEEGRAKATDGIDGGRPSEVHSHSSEQKERFQKEGDRR